MSLVSDIFGRLRQDWRKITGFGGKRDYYEVFGYPKSLTFDHFLQKYQRQDIAQRVINMPVNACWTNPPDLLESEDGAKRWKEFEELAKKHRIWPALRKTDIFAGIGRYAILIVGLDDGRNLQQPVNTARAKNTITYLQPWLESSVEIVEFDEVPTSPRFGLPVMYEVTPTDQPISATANSLKFKLRNKFKVHYSRVLHLADNTMESPVFGHSRLESIFNTLEDLFKIAGGSAETYWLTSNRGMHIDIDKDTELNEDDEQGLSDEIDEYQHELRRVIRTRGVKVNPLGGDVVDPRGAFNVSIALTASNTGIPQRVLLGAEAGQLASQQDRANWSVHVAGVVAAWAEPHVLIPFLELLQAAKVITIPPALYIKWPETFKMSPLERAQTSAQMARSAVNVVRALEVGQKMKCDVLSIEESREIIAPGDKLPVLTGKPRGTFPPPIEEVDPGKFGLLPNPAAPQEDGQLDQPSQPGKTAKAKDPDVSRPEETRGQNA